MTANISRLATRPRVLVLTGAFIAAATLAFAAAYLTRGDTSAPNNANALFGPIAPAFGTDPFHNGEKMTLAGAVNAAGYQIPQANVSGVAAPASLGDVWFASTPVDGGPATNRQVALYYPSSGIEITMWPSQMSDPATGFAQIASDWGDPSSVLQTVHSGLPALVYNQDSDATGANPGSVTFVLNGLYIEVLGYLPTDQLIQVAGSLG